MIEEVNRRHKSDGEKYRVTEKRDAASAKGESKMDQERKIVMRENKGLRGKMKGTNAKEEN